MIDHKITEGDVLIVDRSLALKTNSVAVLNFEGELVVKKIVKKKEKYFNFILVKNSTKEIEINTNLNIYLGSCNLCYSQTIMPRKKL